MNDTECFSFAEKLFWGHTILNSIFYSTNLYKIFGILLNENDEFLIAMKKIEHSSISIQ